MEIDSSRAIGDHEDAETVYVITLCNLSITMRRYNAFYINSALVVPMDRIFGWVRVMVYIMYYDPGAILANHKFKSGVRREPQVHMSASPGLNSSRGSNFHVIMIFIR